MTQENFDYVATIKELKKASRVSLSMVVLGALCLIGSLVYSATRLAPLEEEIKHKSHQIKKLSQTEQDYLNKIDLAKKHYEELRTNIEKLYAVKVTSENNVYELKATAKATGRTTSHGPGYNFSIFVNAPPITLNKIKKVTYLFDHPTFHEKVRVADDANNQFQTKYYGWGCLTNVSATLELKNSEQQKIDFNMCQSLGPQWWREDRNQPSKHRD